LKASIIIITYNGSQKIARLLNSLNLIAGNDFEVIIVNDGSNDNTVEVIKSLKLKYNYKIISQDNKGRAAAKNSGASVASNDLYWFIDDDMRIDPGALNAHLTHHAAHPETISVGTQIEDEPLMTTDIQKYKCHISNGWKLQIESAANPLSAANLYMTSANVSIPASIFNSLNGFDEKLRDAEDLDFVYRAYLAGIPVYYNAAAMGFHMDLITCKSYINRNRQYMEGYEILRRMKPHYMNINSRMHLHKLNGKKKIILSIISQPLFVTMVDKFNIFKILLPVKWRYLFYEMLILGLGRVYAGRKI
jgi:glycosyltransferase involved in cell wall biosynthesis